MPYHSPSTVASRKPIGLSWTLQLLFDAPWSMQGVTPLGFLPAAPHCCLHLSASYTSLQGEKENKRVWMIGLVMTLEIPFWQCTKSSLKALKNSLKIWALNSVAGPGQEPPLSPMLGADHADSNLPCPKTLPFQLGLNTVPSSAAFPFLSLENCHGSVLSKTEPSVSQVYIETVELSYSYTAHAMHSLGGLIPSGSWATPLCSKHMNQVLKNHGIHLMIMRFNKNKHRFLSICF